MRNIFALAQLRDTLAADRKRHDQSAWAKIKLKGKFPAGVRRMEVDCATAACAAGHACLLAGDVFIITPGDVEYDDNDKPYYHPENVRTSDGDEVDLQARAGSLLGLTPAEERELFHWEHSRKHTIDLLDRLIAGEVIA